jgi:hypothetical protein
LQNDVHQQPINYRIVTNLFDTDFNISFVVFYHVTVILYIMYGSFNDPVGGSDYVVSDVGLIS